MLHSLARCTRPASPRHTRSYYDMHMLCSRAEVEDALLACQETDFVQSCNILKRFLQAYTSQSVLIVTFFSCICIFLVLLLHGAQLIPIREGYIASIL